jgi:hypothetical protein
MALPAKKTKKGAKPVKKSKTAKRTALGILAAAAMVVTTGLAAADPLTVSTASGVSATLYGTLQFDGIWDSARAYTSGSSGSSSDVDLWAPEQKTGQPKNDAETRLTANATRFGVNISRPSDDGVVINGKFETDFFGNSGGESAPGIRIRHAYGDISLPDYGFDLLAGQTWDVFGALNSPILDSGALYYSGNVGTRRPQIRLTEGFIFADTGRIELALAAVRPIGQANVLVTSQTDTGRSADIPTTEARLGFKIPTWVDKQTFNLGISGLYGQDQVFITALHSINLDVKGAVVDAEIPVLGWFSLAGKAYGGANLGQYSGTVGGEFFVPGNNTTITAANYQLIQDYIGEGGWAALRLKPGKWIINFGFGEDKLLNDNASLPYGTGVADPKIKNLTGFANVGYLVTPTTKIAAEFGHTETTYYVHANNTESAADLNRVNVVVAYGF